MIDLNRQHLADALKLVAPATKAGDTRYNGRVRLTGSGNLVVQAFNGDFAITTEVDTAAIFGTIVVHHDPLTRWVATASDTITLEVDDNTIRLSADSGNVELPTLPADDLPLIPEADADPTAVKPDTLAALAGILYAASTDQARPVLTGVGLADGWAVCTDSYRLAAVKIDAGLSDAIIPAELVRHALKHADGELTLRVDERHATIATAAAVWTGRLIQGQFPTWQRLVGDTTGRLGCDRQHLLDALERVNLFGSEWVGITPGDNGIRLETKGEGGGNATAAVDGTVDETMAFGIRFLVDLVKALPDDAVNINTAGATKPAIVGSISGGAVHLLMPVRRS